ncbi:hypothetical protein FXB78_05745 [Aggregatibacter actinomycetemcomitans]|uniref:hypothetical protein n=1 Tax=Aggregatibacter actinomycetemcomitans TaxID=714 RepID=UPI0011D36EF1|nr:hypothetical protein [Aggregatibacter actinomycetemcomitans]TYB29169.1 hypothetical protein FXB78_05745 [Aggregatibacter actinomycetemcomitans]
MTSKEIREYAEAVIVAFERKKPVKAKIMKVADSKRVFAIISEYLAAKKRGVDLEAYLAETREEGVTITA